MSDEKKRNVIDEFAESLGAKKFAMIYLTPDENLCIQLSSKTGIVDTLGFAEALSVTARLRLVPKEEKGSNEKKE